MLQEITGQTAQNDLRCSTFINSWYKTTHWNRMFLHQHRILGCNIYNYHSICQRKVKLEKTFKEHHTTKGSQQCQKNKKHLRSSLTIFNCLLQHKGCGLLIWYLSPTRSQEGCHHLSLSTENKQPMSMICWASFGCCFDVCPPPYDGINGTIWWWRSFHQIYWTAFPPNHLDIKIFGAAFPQNHFNIKILKY